MRPVRFRLTTAYEWAPVHALAAVACARGDAESVTALLGAEVATPVEMARLLDELGITMTAQMEALDAAPPRPRVVLLALCAHDLARWRTYAQAQDGVEGGELSFVWGPNDEYAVGFRLDESVPLGWADATFPAVEESNV